MYPTKEWIRDHTDRYTGEVVIDARTLERMIYCIEDLDRRCKEWEAKYDIVIKEIMSRKNLETPAIFIYKDESLKK